MTLKQTACNNTELGKLQGEVKQLTIINERNSRDYQTLKTNNDKITQEYKIYQKKK